MDDELAIRVRLHLAAARDPEPEPPAAKPKRRRQRSSRWDNVPQVTIPVVVPTCPRCKSTNYLHVRGGKANGTEAEQVICRQCSTLFLIGREIVPSCELAKRLADFA